MNHVNVFSVPPTNLHDLNDALNCVDQKKGFFDTGLYVVSKDVRHILKEVKTDSGKKEFPFERSERARIVLAEITNVFLRTAADAEISEIDRFQELFSSYCIHLLEDKWSKSFISFVECAEKSVKKIIKNLHELKNQDVTSLLLITDVDDQKHGAMGIRAVRYLSQGIPVVMPYQQLCKVIDHTFNPPWYGEFNDDVTAKLKLATAKKTCFEIKNSEKWALYTNGNLIAVLLKNSLEMLNLENYKEVSFEDVKKNAVLRTIGEPFYHHKVEADEIVGILSTDTKKHVIWAGHGSLKNMDGERQAMGLTLNDVNAVFKRVKNVDFWDLHSCYLLGNIRMLMEEAGNRDSHIKISNGFIASSSPPKDSDDMTSAYLFLVSKALSKGKAHKIAKIFPLMENFVPENHPHWISKESKEIAPFTFPGMIEKASTLEGTCTVERLYIDKPLVMEPLSLSGEVALLPGLAEESTHHFLNAVLTDQSFEAFIASAFGHMSESREFFMIKELQCQDAFYEKVIYFKEGSEAKVFFCKEGSAYTFDIKWWDSGQPLKAGYKKSDVKAYTENLEEWIQKVVIPSERNISFCQAVSETFNLLLNISKTEKNTILDAKEKKEPIEFSSNKNTTWGAFCRALIHQDDEKVALLYKNFRIKDVKEIFEFLIECNLAEEFITLLNFIKEVDADLLKKTADNRFSIKALGFEDLTLNDTIVSYTIKMRQIEILKQLTIEKIEDALDDAACYGTPAIFDLIRIQASEVDLKSFISRAEVHENWEMVAHLQ